METLAEHFIRPMRAVFNAPQGDDEGSFFAMLAEDAGDVTEHQCREAVKHFRQTRQRRDFPNIAECLDALRKVPKYAGHEAPKKPAPGWSFKRQADDFLRTPQGQICARQGWATDVWAYIAEHGTPPDKATAQRIKAGCLRAWERVEAAAYAEANTNAELATVLLARQALEAMVSRRQRIETLALGGAQMEAAE